MPKGEFVGQFAQAPWISLHRHGGSNLEISMPLDIPKHETAKNPGGEPLVIT
jgi:hypothetical protein